MVNTKAASKGGHKRSGLLGSSPVEEAAPTTAPGAYVQRMQELAKRSAAHDAHQGPSVPLQGETATSLGGTDLSPNEALEQALTGRAGHAEVSIEHVGQLVMLRIKSIKRCPYQPRVKLDPEHVAEIAESVRVDKLNDPITVRPYTPTGDDDPDWEFELISGENRIEAFKLLGESLIPAIIKQYDDIQAARMAVFSNKKRKGYSHYEEFLGYRMLLEMGAVKSQNQMAIDAEMSKAEMSRLMSFAKLPQSAFGLLNATPALIGSNVASALSAFSERTDYEELVLAVLRKVGAGEIDQTKAGDWISKQINPKPAKEAGTGNEKKSVTFHGGRTYATVKRDGKAIRIDLDATVDREDFERGLLEFLEARAHASQ